MKGVNEGRRLEKLFFYQIRELNQVHDAEPPPESAKGYRKGVPHQVKK
jgi:hypothetical protein